MTIEFAFPGRFTDLVIRDKPDLQSDSTNTGIEVTSAVSEKREEAQSIYGGLSAKTGTDRERDIHRLQQLGAQYITVPIHGSPGVHFLAGPNGKDDFADIHKCHRHKLEKLNQGGYADFARYQLYIRSEILSDTEMRDEALLIMLHDAEKYEKHFELIYVAVPEHVYEFNLGERKSIEIPFPSADQWSCVIEARRMVWQGEHPLDKSNGGVAPGHDSGTMAS